MGSDSARTLIHPTQTTMSITLLTANHRDTLAPETLTLIAMYLADNFDLGAMLEFIDEYSEVTFQDYYEQYVELGEDYGYEAVDAWLTLADADELAKFTDAYIGQFHWPADMAEDYLSYEFQDADSRLCIDWCETAEHLLAHEVDRVGDFYFRSSY